MVKALRVFSHEANNIEQELQARQSRHAMWSALKGEEKQSLLSSEAKKEKGITSEISRF